jgi:hypothetical protein
MHEVKNSVVPIDSGEKYLHVKEGQGFRAFFAAPR